MQEVWQSPYTFIRLDNWLIEWDARPYWVSVKVVVYIVLNCCQDEYTAVPEPAVGDGDMKLQYSMNQPPTSSSRGPPLHTRLQHPLHQTAELSSSLPYGLNSPPPSNRLQQLQQQQQRGPLLHHSHSLPSSPQKLHRQLQGQSPLCGSNIYHTASFGDVSPYSVVEKTTTNRSKVLPKEVTVQLGL